MEYPWYLTILLIVSFLPTEYASHFKGGAIYWKPTGNGKEIRITVRSAWISSNYYCDTQSIINEQGTGDSMSLQCFSACSNGLSLGIANTCSDYGITDSWSQGEGNETHTFAESVPIVIGYESTAWVSLVNTYNNGRWKVVTKIDMQTRFDTNKINSSPQMSVIQVIRILRGCSATVTIPVTDDDGDVIRCRWALASSDECGSVCSKHIITSLNQNSCKLSVSTYAATTDGYYPVAIQIEDFVNTTSTNALSSVPLQFLVHVHSVATASCSDVPVITYPDVISDPYAVIQSDSTFTLTIVAWTTSSIKSITEIVIVSPLGMTKSDLAIYGDTGREWSINVNWTPKTYQEGSNYLCIAAYDNDGLQSPQKCLRIVVSNENYVPRMSCRYLKHKKGKCFNLNVKKQLPSQDLMTGISCVIKINISVLSQKSVVS